MSEIATTKMSSKGQVVIPEAIRKSMNLETGARFVVVGEGDVVILKAITPPSMSAFSRVIGRAREQAEEVGLTKADIDAAVKSVRKTK